MLSLVPVPLGPESITWWPPAAATSTAYLVSRSPCRSAKSTSSRRSSPRQDRSRLPDMGATGGASGTSSPASSAATWARERMPSTVIPGTIDASWADGSGTKTRVTPRAAAASTMGSTPATHRSRPSRDTSPMKAVDSSAWRGTTVSAARTAMQIARSKWVPRLSRSAGESSTVIRLVAGHRRSLLMIAMRHRSRASWSAGSARPTRVVPTAPGDTSAWTSMRCPTAPSRHTERAVANGIRSPSRARPRPAPAAV